MKHIKDYVNPNGVKSKVVGRLELTTEDFIRDHCCVRAVETHKDIFVKEYNDLLEALCSLNLIVLSGNNYPNGILQVTELSGEFTKGVSTTIIAAFNRKKVDVSYSLDLNTNLHSQEIISQGGMGFDTYVAMKFLRTKLTAIERGITFELSLQDMKRLLSVKRCYYSSVLLTLEGEHAVSLDRIDCTEGYTKQNVVSCSKTVNGLKNTLLESKDQTKHFSDKELKKLFTSFVALI